jgi:hypothetical protein
MPDPQHKIVQVEGLGAVAFPQSMADDQVAQAIKAHKSKSAPTTTPAMDPRLGAVEKEFPRLAPYLSNVMIQQGKKTNPNDDRGLEFYNPWQGNNPNPGKLTIELFDKLQGSALTNALGGDLLHYLGGYDWKAKKPIDPQYWAMKQAVLKARTPKQEALDRSIYEEEKKKYPNTGTYEDWLQESRIDAYIRGYVTPELGGRYPDEWRKNGFYKDPAMLKAVEAIRQYVTTSPQAKTTLDQVKEKAAQLQSGGNK